MTLKSYVKSHDDESDEVDDFGSEFSDAIEIAFHTPMNANCCGMVAIFDLLREDSNCFQKDLMITLIAVVVDVRSYDFFWGLRLQYFGVYSRGGLPMLSLQDRFQKKSRK